MKKILARRFLRPSSFLTHSNIFTLCSPPMNFGCPRGSRIKWRASTYIILSTNLCSQNNHNPYDRLRGLWQPSFTFIKVSSLSKKKKIHPLKTKIFPLASKFPFLARCLNIFYTYTYSLSSSCYVIHTSSPPNNLFL